MRPFLACIGCLLSLTSMTWAETTLVHAPDYHIGQVARTEVEAETQQTLTIAGMNVETTGNHFFVIKETVQRISDGETLMRGEFEVFQVETGLPGGQKLQFDKASAPADDEQGPLGDMTQLFKLMSRSPWQARLDPRGQMMSMEWLDIPPAEIPDLFQDELSSERFIKAHNVAVNRLPGKTVTAGERWNRTEEQNLGNGQFFTLSRTFTYQGKVDRMGRSLDHVTFRTDSVKYHMNGNPAIPLRLKESDLKVESGQGAFWFDSQKKQIVEVDDKLHVTGSLVFTANEVELPATLDLTMRTHHTVK